jgi:hypothetical protein
MVVNEGEFEVIFGQRVPENPALPGEAMAGRKAPTFLVVTLGGRSALIWLSGESTQIPAPSVNVVDTTGAGDTFVGALGNALAKGESLLMPRTGRSARRPFRRSPSVQPLACPRTSSSANSRENPLLSTTSENQRSGCSAVSGKEHLAS